METLNRNGSGKESSKGLIDSSTVFQLISDKSPNFSQDVVNPDLLEKAASVPDTPPPIIYRHNNSPSSSLSLPPPLSEIDSLQNQEASRIKKSRRTWVNQVGEEYNVALTQGIIPIDKLIELDSIKNYFQKLSYFKTNVRQVLLTRSDIQENNSHYDPELGSINFWGAFSSPAHSDNQAQMDEQQIPADQNYVAGLMRISGILEFIGETELTPQDRQIIYELYESGELPYDIAMDTEENRYQASPEEFYKRIEPHLRPYKQETLREDLEVLFTKNTVYQERYGNISHTIVDLFWEGHLPLNFTLLPFDKFDELVSVGMKKHDIDFFDYICRANRLMGTMSPNEKAHIFQILSDDQTYHINDDYFVRQERVERAFKKVKGPFFEKVGLRLIDMGTTKRNRRKSNYQLIETF